MKDTTSFFRYLQQYNFIVGRLHTDDCDIQQYYLYTVPRLFYMQLNKNV